jgi:hypothetical protein
MKIQDMRSGILHLNKRMDREHQEIYPRHDAAQPARAVADRGPEDRAEIRSELEEPRWSVVSFDKREAGGLTYRQAAELAAILDTYKINGLCIITDEAAKRYDR